MQDKDLWNQIGRSSNTSPRVTSLNGDTPQEKLNICIDWFTFTAQQHVHFDDENLQRVINYIKPILDILKVDSNVYTLEKGRANYKHKIIFEENFLFFFNGPSKTMDDIKSFMFELSGQACRKFDDKYEEGTFTHWYELANVLLNYPNPMVTRIDTPIDDFDGTIMPFEYFKEKILKKEYTSSATSYTYIQNKEKDGRITGETLSIGSVDSGRQLVVYNKILEREKAGEIIKPGISYWYRYELRHKNDDRHRAMCLFYKLYDHKFNLKEVVPGLFIDYVRLFEVEKEFKMFPTPETNLPIDEKYERFLNTATKVKLENIYIKHKTISTLSNWIERSVSKASLMLDLSEDDDTNDNYRKYLKILAIDKIKQSDIDAINEYRTIHNNKKIKYKDLIHYKYKLMEQLNIHQNIEGKYVDENGDIVKFYK